MWQYRKATARTLHPPVTCTAVGLMLHMPFMLDFLLRILARPRQVVFVGLDVIVPLITEDLLKIPKLCRLYFGLLGYMLEAFPERMAALPGADFVEKHQCVQMKVLVPMLTMRSHRSLSHHHSLPCKPQSASG